MQQTKGYFNPNLRLVDTRNRQGETPLLRAATTGVISVIKVCGCELGNLFVHEVAQALLEEGSDPFAVGCSGGTVFTALCGGGHLWGTHFMHQHVRYCVLYGIISHYVLLQCVRSARYGSDAALALLCQPDSEDRTPLDWAACAGSVNLLELLLRKGAPLNRADRCNRTALFWAVENNRVAAARFLVLCGSDASLANTEGITPRDMATKGRQHSRDLLFALNAGSSAKCIDKPGALAFSNSPKCTVCAGRSATARSHAIYIRHSSRVSHVLVYAFIICAVWVLTLVIPFYAWLAVVVVIAYSFRCSPLSCR